MLEEFIHCTKTCVVDGCRDPRALHVGIRYDVYPEDGSTNSFRFFSTHIPNYTALHIGILPY